MKLLSRPEELILLAVWHLKNDAYLVTIRDFISKKTGKEWSVGAVYVPLDRLTKSKYVETFWGEATPERGGRRKKFYTITEEGFAALEELQRVHNSFWEDYPQIDMSGGVA